MLAGLNKLEVGAICETYGCQKEARYSIGNKDGGFVASFNLCEECLRDIITDIKALGLIDIKQEQQEQQEEEEENITAYTNRELRELLQSKGVTEGYTDKTTKADLIDLLERS